MELFHFGLAPASQDGGSCSSPTPQLPLVHNLLLKFFLYIQISLLNLPGLFLALPVLYLKRQINFFYIVKIFVYFFSLNIGSELKLEL